MKTPRAFVAVACAVAALAAPEARAGGVPERFRVKSFADVAPPTTIFFLDIPDYARARAAYRATPRWGLWWEGAGRKLISQWIGAEGDADLSAAIGAFADAAALPTGKVAFIIEGPDPEDEFGMPMSALLAEVGGKAEEFKRCIKKMWGVGFVEEDEALIQRVRFAEMDELLIGSEGDLVMGGLGRTGLNGLLSRFAERPWQSLAGNPAYKLAKARALDGAHFMTFTNYTDIWRMLAMELDEEWLPVERTGLPQLAATSLSGRFTPEGVVDKVSFILRGRARGMWDILRPEPLSRKAWALLPEFTSGFVTARLPGRTQPFLEMLRTLDPEMAEEFLEPFVEFREATGVNFERDLLRLATGEYTAVFLEDVPGAPPAEPDGMDMGPESLLRNLVLFIELADPAKARATMDRLAAVDLDGERLGRKRRFGQLEGWVLGDEMGGRMYVSGSGAIGMLAFSPEPIERLAAHIAKGGAKLVDSQEFREATAWIPADTGFAAYSNVRKIMRSLHALASSQIEMMADDPVELPKADALFEGLSPLTACVRIEKPGFAFEIHSPDGIWAYYFQMAAHCIWRFEEQPMRARRRARRGGLPPVPADADPEVAKAYARLTADIGKCKTPEQRIAMLLAAAPKFKGTPYERHIQMAIMRGKDVRARDAYVKLMAGLAKIKRPEDKIAFLKAKRPEFAGTSFEKAIGAMIAREQAMLAKERTADDRAPRPAAPRGVRAKVLAVRPELDLVMISVGRDDGVKPGDVLAVRRGGRLIARARVEKSFADMSSAKVFERTGGAKVREDDEARIEGTGGDAPPRPPDGPAEEDDVF